MKRLYFLPAILILFLVSSPLQAQKYNPEIKTGTLFKYEFKGKDGAVLLVNGAITSTDKGALAFTDTLRFNNQFQVYKTVISKTAMGRADKMKPPTDEPTSTQRGVSLFVLSDDKTDHCFSRLFLKTIKEQKAATYGGITYTLSNMPAGEAFKLNGKEVDAVYFVSSNGQKKFWVLNNTMYPLILRSSSENINAVLTGIQ
jgi:hypothetical protein